MRDLREILRQKLQLGRSHRKTAEVVRISAGSVARACIRAKALGLDWEAVERLDDEQLETRMYGPRGGKRDGRSEPDLPYIHVELRRTGVTLSLLQFAGFVLTSLLGGVVYLAGAYPAISSGAQESGDADAVGSDPDQGRTRQPEKAA